MDRKFWTDEQTDLLRSLLASGKTFEAAAAIVGRSAHCCRTRLQRLERAAARRVEGTHRRDVRPWSHAEIAELLRLRDVEKLTFKQIGQRLGRRGCNWKWRMVKAEDVASAVLVSRQDAIVPAERLADRDARLRLQHIDFTAACFGDPLPGRSALDQRRGA